MATDVWLFKLVNRGSANPLFDWLMPIVTNGSLVQWTLIGAGVVVIALAYRKGERQGITWAWRVVGIAVLAFVTSETIGGQILKPLVARPRPPLGLGLEQVRLLVGLGPSYSFPSGHSYNSAAVCTALAKGYPRYAWLCCGYALLIAFSRVYVGVHYPVDVTCGLLLGATVCGLLWYALPFGEPTE